MFSTITKFFKKKKKETEEALDFPKLLILEDITYENEVKISKTKERDRASDHVWTGYRGIKTNRGICIF